MTRYVETRTPIVSTQEIIDINNGLIRHVTGGAFEMGAGVALLVGGTIYDGYLSVYPLLAIGVIGVAFTIRGMTRMLAGGFVLIGGHIPENVHIEESEAPEPSGNEMTDADTILAYVAGSPTPVHISRARPRQTVGGFTFRGKLLDALTQQERERGDGTLHRDSLVAAGLIGTTDYTAMTRALVEVGYAEPYGRGYKWTDAGRDWITDDRPTPTG